MQTEQETSATRHRLIAIQYPNSWHICAKWSRICSLYSSRNVAVITDCWFWLDFCFTINELSRSYETSMCELSCESDLQKWKHVSDKARDHANIAVALVQCVCVCPHCEGLAWSLTHTITSFSNKMRMETHLKIRVVSYEFNTLINSFIYNK